MNRRKEVCRLVCTIIITVVFVFSLSPQIFATSGKVSFPGKYSGYSKEIYGHVVRISKYIYIRGVNLAIDLYRPSNDGIKPVNDPWPVLFQNYHYSRDSIKPEEQINLWVKHGYVVAVLDPRGTAASFGYQAYQWNWEEMLDGKEVIEWLARQPWCNGKVAMWGVSYMGGAQLLIAATKPPHLVSVIPVVTTIDQYGRHPNGVFLDMSFPSKMDKERMTKGGKPVDADPSGNMMRAAIPEHVEKSFYLIDMWPKPGLFRNDYIAGMNNMPSIVASPITYKDEIKGSGIPMYNIGGGHDQAPGSQLGAWKLWGGKILIGPWGHGVGHEEISKIEHLRWFDYTTKGIQNGIMDEPPIYYATINAPKGEEWKFANEWPLPNQKLTDFYFDGGPTGTVNSVNDGGLGTSVPNEQSSKDDYTVDYDVKLFGGKYRENNRTWDGDMAPDCDSKGLTYTTEPLSEDMEITGHPVVHLQVASTSKDGYFFAFLEEIDGATNKSSFVSNGMIRAANRAEHDKSPWTEMGIPYHRCFDVDTKDLIPGEVVELAFDMYPTSYIFRKGNRIRITVTGSFRQTYPGMKEDPAPTVSIYRDAKYKSHITLPIIPPAK